MKKTLFLILLISLLANNLQAQDVKYGSAQFSIGSDPWTGILVPDGLWGSTRFGTDFQLYSSMWQQNSITPAWVQVYNSTYELPVDNGMQVYWEVDLPKPGGWINCKYQGKFRCSTSMWNKIYYIDYRVIVTYHSY